MLEGTDEAPRRRWLSKDFSALFAAGMLVAWINAVIIIRAAGVREYYETERVELPLPTQLLFSSNIIFHLALVSVAFMGILALFWFKQCRKSIWVLSLWMLWNTPFTFFVATMPVLPIVIGLRKPNTLPYYDYVADYRPWAAGIAWIELGLTLLLVGCLIHVLHKSAAKK